MEPRLNWSGKESLTLDEEYLIWEWESGDNNPVAAPNMLLHGDNYKYLLWLQESKLQFDLIYLDPPFLTGNTFKCQLQIDGDTVKIEIPAFSDRWDNSINGYLNMMYPRLKLLRDLLKDTGSIFVHLDWRATHYIKIIMDELFGRDNFRNEIIWWYHDPSGRPGDYYLRKHDVILFYSKTDKYKFNLDAVRVSYAASTQRQAQRKDVSFGRPTVLHSLGKPPEDVWEIPIINSQARERLGYPTQKPLELLSRIIKGSSEQGDLILDPFCGSGTTLEAAARLKRKWVGIEQCSLGINLARQRLKDFSPEISLREHREELSLKKDCQAFLKELYSVEIEPGSSLQVADKLVVFALPLEKLQAVIGEVRGIRAVHLWGGKYPWGQMEIIENEMKSKGIEILFFQIGDRSGLPLPRADLGIITEGDKKFLILKDYEQPEQEKGEFYKIMPIMMIREIAIINSRGEKISWNTTNMQSLPWKRQIPLPGLEEEIILIRFRDILGRYRCWERYG